MSTSNTLFQHLLYAETKDATTFQSAYTSLCVAEVNGMAEGSQTKREHLGPPRCVKQEDKIHVKNEAFTLCLEAIRDQASYHPEHTIYSQAMCLWKDKSQLETCLDVTAQQQYDRGKKRWERKS